MPPTPAPSNIRAFVNWKDSNVYAGEEIECIITFKNVATIEEQHKEKSEPPNTASNGFLHAGRRPSYATPADHSRGSSMMQNKSSMSKAPSTTSVRGGPASRRGHKPALSLNVLGGSAQQGMHTAPLPVRTPNSAVRPAKGHERSLSIMSLGSDAPSGWRAPTTVQATKRPVRAHGRSASLQFVPRPPSQQAGSTVSGLSSRQPSPLYESTTPPIPGGATGEVPSIRPPRRRPGAVSADHTPLLGRQNTTYRPMPIGAFNPNFQFPPPQQTKNPSPKGDHAKPPRSPSTMHSAQQRPVSPRPAEGWSGALGNLNPISRVMSETNSSGTPRTSSEFYSMSNRSDETLTSEVPSQAQTNARLLPKSSRERQPSRSRQPGQQTLAVPEALMMGYAKTMGYFTLDGSLINTAPFEEVKRKGVQGGGGVVGLERTRRTSGMFGNFSWGNVGESLSGFLSTDEKSSMAQMKASVGSRSIPLLSTPQNLLFVDLRLAPGESKSYNYRFALPRGLPPSHKGRAIKVVYALSLGVQRPAGQSVQHIEIPFRVLGSYDGRGEALGHDLMSPYILLKDAAQSTATATDSFASSDFPKTSSRPPPNQSQKPKQGLEDFLRYTERLLDEPKDAHGALMSPTSPTSPSLTRTQSLADQPPDNIKDAVDFAILRANRASTAVNPHHPSTQQSTNRFNIARAGQPVAVLTLLRPAYRLGETVVGTIDFTTASPSAAHTPTYSVLVSLESTERIDPSLALRSSNSIQRVTRRVHASTRENVLCASQAGFSLAVPAGATPSFETTGVSLAWRLKVEFTTAREQQQQQQPRGLGLDEDVGGSRGHIDAGLMEEVGSDERGTTLMARERLLAETFEVEVPVRVYGTPGVEGGSGEVAALEI